LSTLFCDEERNDEILPPFSPTEVFKIVNSAKLNNSILQIACLVPQECKPQTVSKEFIQQFGQTAEGKLEKKRLKSLRILRFSMRSFFYCSTEFNDLFWCDCKLHC